MRRSNFQIIIGFLLLTLFCLPIVAGAQTYYVRPQAEAGTYGAEDGSSYENAWNGLNAVQWAKPKEVGKVGPGDTLYVCGLYLHETDDVTPIGGESTDPVSGSEENNRVVIRGDCPEEQGIIWGGYINNDPAYDWEVENASQNIYKQKIANRPDEDWYFEDVNSTHWTVLDKVDSIAEVGNNPGSQYSPDYDFGSYLYLQCSDSGDPSGRILIDRPGIGFDITGDSYITFKNMKFYNTGMPQGGNIVNTTDITFNNCTMMYGGSRMISLHYENGVSGWKILNCEIAHAGNGIYTISNEANGISDYSFNYNYIHDIGVRDSLQNGDAHAIGIQGGENGEIIGNVINNCGSGVTLYAYTFQTLKNTTVKYNYVKNLHTLGGANSRGFETCCNNNSLSDKSGNVFAYNIIQNSKIGLRMQFEDEQKILNNLIIDCEYGIYCARSYNDGFNTWGPSIHLRNNIFYNNKFEDIVYKTSANEPYATIDINYNCFFPSYKSQDVNKGDQSLIEDPQFVNIIDSDFKLNSNSNIIDKGIDVGINKDFNFENIIGKPDIGPFEYQSKIFPPSELRKVK